MSFPISTQAIERLTESFLERPPDEDLRHGNVMLLCELLQSRIVEALPAQDRAVRLDDDAFLLAVFDDRLLLREWVKLNLINLENDGAECQRKVVRTSSEVKSLTSGVSRPASLICFKCSTPCRYQSPLVSLGTSSRVRARTRAGLTKLETPIDCRTPASRFSMSTFQASRRFCLPAVGSCSKNRSCIRTQLSVSCDPCAPVKSATKSKTHPLQAVLGGDRDALVDGFPGLLRPVLVAHHFGREPDFAVTLVRHRFVEFLDRSADFLLVVVCRNAPSCQADPLTVRVSDDCLQ